MRAAPSIRRASTPPLLLALGFAALVVMSVVSVTLELKWRDDGAQISHTFEVKNALGNLISDVRRIELALRSFLLTDNPRYDDAYSASLTELNHSYARVEKLVTDNPAQQRASAELRALIERRVTEMNQTRQLFVTGAGTAALESVREADLHDTLPQIRQAIEQMDQVESDRLAQRQADTAHTNIRLLTIELAGIVLVVAVAFASVWMVRRSTGARERALRELAAANANLETIVADRTANLEARTAESKRLAEILTQTIACMPDGILVIDEKGDIVFSNPAARRLFGDTNAVSSAEWVASFPRFQPDGVTPLPPAETPILRAAAGQTVDNVEIIIRNVRDQDLHIVANGRPIRDLNGALKGAVMIYRDVTVEKETERQLRQSQKMDAIGQLTGGIAHDFNNILTVITGTIEILAEGVKDKPTLAAVADMIDEAAERGAELTGRLLAFARKQPLQPRETDINAFVVDAAKLLRPTLGANIEIEAMLDHDTVPALVDPGQLTAALLNLAINARDAMPDGGKLTLETGNVVLDESYVQANADIKPGRYVLVAVSDSGIGIPVAIRDKVFEPFFTTKEMGKGTGLGLSMVYGFAKQTGGHVKIYSEEQQGTTVKLYLPQSSGSVEAGHGVADSPALRGGDETILVVEDDRLVLDYVTVQLRNLGYTVLTATTAAAALALVDAGRPFDLLFTDVIMPGGMNGKALAEEIKRRRPAIKVLFTSGYTENAIIHHGRLDRGVLLLQKPYRKSDLARMLRVALDQNAERAGTTA